MMAFPLSYKDIAQRQTTDIFIRKALRKKLKGYKKTIYPSGEKKFTLVTKNGKIVLLTALQKPGVQMYHEALMHPGETRTELTMGQHFTWKGMCKMVTDVCKCCASCQLNKTKPLRVGQLPEKEAEMIPWECVCIDLIGPYTIGEESGNTTTLHCLTMINPATGWFEITEIPVKMTDVVNNILKNEWLTWYPYPTEVVMD